MRKPYGTLLHFWKLRIFSKLEILYLVVDFGTVIPLIIWSFTLLVDPADALRKTECWAFDFSQL